MPTPKPSPIRPIKFDREGWAVDDRVQIIKSPNNSGRLRNESNYAIMHYTAGGRYSGTVNHFQNRNAQASAHFVIGRQGQLVQMVSILNKAWHAGRSEWMGIPGMNSHSIGFEFANWGWLNKSRSGLYINHLGRVFDGPVVSEQAFGKYYWEEYPDAQVRAGLILLGSIEGYKRSRGEGFIDVLGHSDVSPGRKTDPGPAFPLYKFRKIVDDRSSDKGLAS